MEIEPKIMSQVKSILGEFGNKYLTSKGSLKRNNVINDLDKFDRELMTKLFKDPLMVDCNIRSNVYRYTVPYG